MSKYKPYEIDRYKLNLFCVCLNCSKYRGSRNDFSKYCDAYPKIFHLKFGMEKI